MLSISPKINYSDQAEYLGGVFLQQIIFCLINWIFFLIFSIFIFSIFFDFDLSNLYLTFSFLIIVSQFFQFFRKLYIFKNYLKKLIVVDIIYLLLLVSSLFYYNYFENLNIKNVFKALIFSYLFCLILFIFVIREFKLNKIGFIKSFKENWIISKWLIASSITQWFCGNLWVLNSGILLGPYYLGIIRACQTILNVFNILFQTIENIFPIIISKKLVKEGKESMKKYIDQLMIIGFFSILLFSIFLSLISKYLLLLIFGAEVASENIIFIFLCFLLPLTYLNYLPQHALRAFLKTKPILIAYFISGLYSLSFSYTIISEFKISGFIFGLFSSQILILIIIFFYYYKELKKFQYP
mgnify:FL=1